MTKSRSDRKQQAICLVLDAGPRTTAELVAQLAERGIRIDSTELFLLCNEFGLATFDATTNTWAVPGTVRPAQTRPERREADRQIGLRRQPGIDIRSRVELRKMRELLLDDETPDTPAEYPIHPSWPAIAARYRQRCATNYPLSHASGHSRRYHWLPVSWSSARPLG
ncbi:hypothetical protein ACIGO9_34545 [Nocardia asteroides]|uniref:hypothetical protein n=1 Tax=Nocardia asteroides TaxID=1824 RepID=UPI0037C7D3E9